MGTSWAEKILAEMYIEWDSECGVQAGPMAMVSVFLSIIVKTCVGKMELIWGQLSAARPSKRVVLSVPLRQARTQEPGGQGGGGSCPSNLKWGGALPLQLEPGDLPISLNDWYSIYLPRRDISAQIVKRKEHGSLMHWLVDCFQIDLFYFTDLFVWFQMIYMSSSLFNTRTGGGSENHTVWRGGAYNAPPIDLSSYES